MWTGYRRRENLTAFINKKETLRSYQKKEEIKHAACRQQR